MYEHSDAWQQWRKAIGQGRFHHAWLLSGRKGLGKSEFALKAAHELVARQGHPTDPLSHPDILVLARTPKDDKEEKKRQEGKPFVLARNIKIAQIRAMQRRLTTQPTLGEKRVVIVDPADDLEHSASNALLKSLEEPPKGTVFILVAHRPARLLPTIRSRCRLLRFPAMTDERIAKLLKSKAPECDPVDIVAALAIAKGSAGVGLEFLNRNMGNHFALMKQIVDQGDADFVLRGKLQDTVGPRPDREKMQALIDLAQAVVAQTASETTIDRLTLTADTYAELVRLNGQLPVYNFDVSLLVAEIGNLLASVAPLTESNHA